MVQYNTSALVRRNEKKKLHKFLVALSILLGIFNLNSWALSDPEYGIVYTFPTAEAQFVLPESNIIIRFDQFPGILSVYNSEVFAVSGYKGGIYTGDLVLLPERNTIIYKPHTPFMTGDTVTVTIDQSVIQTNIPEFRFFVAQHELKKVENTKPVKTQPKTHIKGLKIETEEASDYGPRIINGVAVPIDFPAFFPSINETTAPGYLFLQNWIGAPYIMILENDGTPYFYRKVEERSRDFKVQPTGVLSRLVRQPYLHHQLMNSNYDPIREIYAQSGYETDEHELTLTSGGNALVIVNDYRTVDMSILVPGGNSSATVIGNNVQEIDQNDNVVFQWNCWDYFDITDAVHENLTASYIDFVHMNSIAVDYDGHLLLSSRHLSECTKINRTTGEIIWRLGGENNQFTFLDGDDGISYQHDIRPVEGHPNHYTIFDNGNYHSPTYSRAVEYYLDTIAMTAENVWEYIYPDGATHWMGNAQRLSNGNTYINWADGALPKATEVTPAGTVVYEGDFEEYTHSYRTFRFEWTGMLLEPELILENYQNQVTLIFNKFGDEDVVGYNIYAGESSNPTTLIGTTTDNYINLISEDLDNNTTYYFMVKAYYANSSESDASNIESTYVDLTIPGTNLISNGGFSDGDNDWTFSLDPSASATGTVNGSGEYVIDISNQGTEYYHVQLLQENIPLLKDHDYIFEFDASADVARTVEIKVEQTMDPWTNYSQNGLTYVEETTNHFVYDFTMESTTDLNARVVVNCGGVTGNLTLDNFSLREDVEINSLEPSSVILDKKNLQAETIFQDKILFLYVMNSEGKELFLRLYDINGRQLLRKNTKSYVMNTFEDRIDFSGYATGIYLLQIMVFDPYNNRTESETLKIYNK